MLKRADAAIYCSGFVVDALSVGVHLWCLNKFFRKLRLVRSFHLLLGFCIKTINMPTCCIKQCNARKRNNQPTLTFHRRKRDYKEIQVVAGSLTTIIFHEDDTQQWRTMERLYTQRFLRFPAFNLAIMEVGTPWSFNNFVNKIPYTQLNQDFDGVCLGTTVKITKSWSTNKRLCKSNFRMINNQDCEYKMLQSCRLYYCTEYDDISMLSSTETEGGGLICYGTGDPAENGNQGVLVGVTSQINVGLPSLHNRIGMFRRWVADGCVAINANLYPLYLYYVFAMG